MNEHFFTCPHCWETISMILDNSVTHQIYIEDCEVCCNPIQIHLEINDRMLRSFQAESIEQ